MHQKMASGIAAPHRFQNVDIYRMPQCRLPNGSMRRACAVAVNVSIRLPWPIPRCRTVATVAIDLPIPDVDGLFTFTPNFEVGLVCLDEFVDVAFAFGRDVLLELMAAVAATPATREQVDLGLLVDFAVDRFHQVGNPVANKI